MTDNFRKDCIELLEQKATEGRISRRRFVQLAALIAGGAPLVLRASESPASANQLVFVGWGGDTQEAYDKVWGKTFEEETGIVVRQDGSGPTEGAIMAQIKSGAPTWDVLDADPFTAIALGKQGMIEEIDYTIVDKAKMRPGFFWDYGASNQFYSYVIAYDSEKFGDNPPTSMADVFDVEKFPGKRTFYKWGVSVWEAALLADGVARADLYPLDLDRAHRKIAAFKDHVAGYWGSGSESQSLMLDGDASIGVIWHTRANALNKDSSGRIKWVWNEGLLTPACMAVVKGNPAGRDTAMQFIASAQDPQKQVALFEIMGNGPANPAADALIPDDLKYLNPVDPANQELQVPLDMEWYADQYSDALNEFTKVISA